MRKSGFLTALLALALVSCGGDSDPADDAFTPGGGGGAVAGVASVTVVTDTPTIPSSGLTPANISVLVRSTGNQFMKDVPVTIAASSGGLAIVNAVTDASGVAKATLSTAGDPASRVITVTATAGGFTSQTTVAVDGSLLDIQGPESLITGTQGTYTVVATDANNAAIAGKVITISSAPASTLGATSVTTDSSGRATFTMTPTSNATITLTAAGLGETKTKVVTVSADSFSFTTPAADNAAFGLNAPGATLTVRWLSSGTPVSAGTVTFSTTRGTVSVASATPAAGDASVTVTSPTAGEAVVSATNSSGGSTQRRIVFVAATAAVLDVQATPFTVSINQSSTLTATVRDASNNLVASKAVDFQLSDPTGGTLSLGSAVTDSQGRARTVYTASSTTSAANGVRVTATVRDTPSVSDFVDLTVAGSPLFLSFGTGNTIEQINSDTQYRLNYTVQVTDANGAGVAGVSVSISALSWEYIKGDRSFAAAPVSRWVTNEYARCVNEDRRTGNPAYDFNGILDPGENENGLNNSNELSMESGNIASILPGSGTTDASGFLAFSVTYPQDHAEYVSIALRARTAVQGTEFSRTTMPFFLPGAAPDFNTQTIAPPGLESPFGIAATCSTYN